MRILWRPEFVPPTREFTIVFSSGTTPADHEELEAAERSLKQTLTRAARELIEPAGLSETLNLLEGRLRGVLLDPSLTPAQQTRLERARAFLAALTVLDRLRPHLERARQCLKEQENGHEATALLARATTAVAWQGESAGQALCSSDPFPITRYPILERAAQQELRRAEVQLQGIVPPAALPVVRAALLALDVAAELLSTLWNASHCPPKPIDSPRLGML